MHYCLTMILEEMISLPPHSNGRTATAEALQLQLF